MLKMLANKRYLNWAETCYNTCNPLFVPNVLLFRKIGGTPFAKSKIQNMSSNFVHCMYLIFEPILLRRKFWGIPLRRNDFFVLSNLADPFIHRRGNWVVSLKSPFSAGNIIKKDFLYWILFFQQSCRGLKFDWF